MALTGNNLSCRLTLLILKFGLLTFNPGQSGDSKEAHGFIIHTQWRSYPYPTKRWIDCKMQVFDVFAYYVNDKVVYSDLVFLLSTHPDSLLDQRSVSPV